MTALRSARVRGREDAMTPGPRPLWLLQAWLVLTLHLETPPPTSPCAAGTLVPILKSCPQGPIALLPVHTLVLLGGWSRGPAGSSLEGLPDPPAAPGRCRLVKVGVWTVPTEPSGIQDPWPAPRLQV